MDEKKNRLNPWAITLIMGVIAVLFSVFGFQQQSELKSARVKLEKLIIADQQIRAAAALSQGQIKIQRDLAEGYRKQLEECRKTSTKLK